MKVLKTSTPYRLLNYRCFAHRLSGFYDCFVSRDNISYSSRRRKGFPQSIRNQIVVRAESRRRDARVFISGGLDQRQIESSLTLRCKQPPKIDNTFIRHPRLTIWRQCSPRLFTSRFLSHCRPYAVRNVCDCKRAIKRAAASTHAL